ncbi:imm11 family protein [Vibrio nigripulchritudo]|uniref:imm11 family protein n=1 Tax=Vibrio nigripulchritudo TaxID=28173 RepID=UPI0003B2055E|nr:DUF1629 domain-containing protein [Vibrio nigripulchritudo]CCN73742.1 conserved hypothetical protein [Vibrio nigripulchritudo SFn118]
MTTFNRVFIVTTNANEFAILQESNLEMSLQATTNNFLDLNGESLASDWPSIDVGWLEVDGESTLPKPDVAAWGAAALAASEETMKKFDGLKTCCEFLPLNLNGERWLTLNITKTIDAIDKEKTVVNLRNGKPSRVRPFKKLVLAKESISDGGIFRVQGAGLRTFCTDQPGGFFDIVTSNNLSGVNFTDVDSE